MGMFEDMKSRLNCAIGEYRIINYRGSLILAKCSRVSWDGVEWSYSFQLGIDGMHTVTLPQADFNKLSFVEMEKAFASMEGE